ncbi:MAG TPA: hypothetical protein VIS47_03895 [Nitrosopumilus sp.]
MVKSLGDYNKEKSSSADTNNIRWTQKNPSEPEKIKNKRKTKKISPTNIIYSDKIDDEQTDERIFKVDKKQDTGKSKNKSSGKKFQKSSVSNCIIKPEFKRPGR